MMRVSVAAFRRMMSPLHRQKARELDGIEDLMDRLNLTDRAICEKLTGKKD